MTNYSTNLEQDLIKKNPELSEYVNDISQSVAERAFYNTSFSPEKRGVYVRFEYAENLLIDKTNLLNEIIKASKRGADVRQGYDVMVDEWFKSHREKLCNHYHSWLHSHSRVASSFITGPANFPVARNQKLSGYADAKYSAIDEFRQKSIKNILNFVLPDGDGFSIQTNDPNACDKIEKKIKEMEAAREMMKEANKVIRKYFKKGCSEIEPEKLAEFKELMKSKFNLQESSILKLIEPTYTGKILGFARFELQNLGANIKRYEKRLDEIKHTKQVTLDQTFDNGISVSISDDQKICIHFGFKPDDETRDLLKKNAFKFSRNRSNAWVRKLTVNAEYSYRKLIKPKLEALEMV